jgi:hypothetical protein
VKDLVELRFCGGPACGRRYKIGKALRRYEHEDGLGQVHEYVVEPSLKYEGVFLAVHAGVLGVR